jgi:glycolate oxidase iron-sulfur subunit
MLERVMRTALKEGLSSPLFKPAMKVGQLVRPLLPQALTNKVPQSTSGRSMQWPQRELARKMLMLAGCVQPAMMPNINCANARVLDAPGIQTLGAPKAACCGAQRRHLNDDEGGLSDMRRNIDAWWPLVEAGTVEAIVMNASGSGVAVKEYGHALAYNPASAEKAKRVGALTRDLSDLLPDLVSVLKDRVQPKGATALAFHPPCTLQHGQQLRGGVETHLGALGFDIKVAPCESLLCCSSAGTYSVLQPKLAYQLRDRKLEHLAELKVSCIVSANIGCIQQLQTSTPTPVRHWIEVPDDALTA